MVTFRYQNTSCYLLPTADDISLLAFDAGWPSSLHEYARSLKATGYRFEQIRWAMVSHFHLDHAGLIRDFQDAGIRCVLFKDQGDGIEDMRRIIRRSYPRYEPILKNGFMSLKTGESREFLASISIRGEVIQSPGHSEDSVYRITDDHEVLIGDLYPETLMA